MSAITRNDITQSLLQEYMSRQTLENFRPNLYFTQLGQEDIKTPDGYNTYSWAKFNVIAEGSITTGTTADDGVSPGDTAFDASRIAITPTQYRIIITIADLTAENNIIDFVKGASEEIGSAMSKKIDSVIQTAVMAGTNIIYGGTKTSRATLASTDVLTAEKFNQADAYLKSKDAMAVGGFYVAVIHPAQLRDLRTESGTGNWLEVNKYVTNDKILKGEQGMLNGIRVLVSSHVNTFTSTTTVYPALVVGKGAYGVAGWENLKTYYVPASSTESDALAQRHKVGAKVAFGVTILKQDSMVRIETGASALI